MNALRLPILSGPGPSLIRLLAVILCGLGLLPGRSAEPAASSSLGAFLKRAGFDAVEFKWEHRAAVVDGRLADKKRAFLLDTGWGVTTLDDRAARELKTLGELNVKLDDGFGAPLSDPDIVLMGELTLGRAVFLNQPAVRRKLKAGSSPWEQDGVLGMDFFFRNHCLFDCAGQRLYVRAAKPSDEVKDTLAKSFRLSGLIEVPMAGRYGTTIDAEMNGQTVKLLVDTGAFATIVDDSQVARLGLKRLKSASPPTGSHIREDVEGRVFGAGEIGREALYASDVKSFRIASQPWKRVQVGVADLVKWGLAKPGTRDQENQGLLGAELLVQHHALIDFSSGRLWLLPER